VVTGSVAVFKKARRVGSRMFAPTSDHTGGSSNEGGENRDRGAGTDGVVIEAPVAVPVYPKYNFLMYY